MTPCLLSRTHVWHDTRHHPRSPVRYPARSPHSAAQGRLVSSPAAPRGVGAELLSITSACPMARVSSACSRSSCVCSRQRLTRRAFAEHAAVRRRVLRSASLSYRPRASSSPLAPAASSLCLSRSLSLALRRPPAWKHPSSPLPCTTPLAQTPWPAMPWLLCPLGATRSNTPPGAAGAAPTARPHNPNRSRWEVGGARAVGAAPREGGRRPCARHAPPHANSDASHVSTEGRTCVPRSSSLAPHLH